MQVRRQLVLSPLLIVFAVATVLLDFEGFITECTSITKAISTSRLQTQSILAARDRLRFVLSVLLTPGLNKDIDIICQEELGISFSTGGLGMTWYVLSSRPPSGTEQV